MSASPSGAVRPRTPADLPACARLLADVHAADGYPVRWPADPVAWLSPDAMRAAWVAVPAGDQVGAEDQLGGHVAVVTTAGGGHKVSRLFVSPAARGQGLGRVLLDVVLDDAGERRRDVVLEVVDGAAAVGLYERLRWRLLSTGPASWSTADGRRPTVRHYAAPG